MKKVLCALTLVAFVGGTSFAATAYDGDPVKTEKKEGDEKKKKAKKAKKADAKKADAKKKKSCSASCCSKKKA